MLLVKVLKHVCVSLHTVVDTSVTSKEEELITSVAFFRQKGDFRSKGNFAVKTPLGDWGRYIL